MIFHFKLTRFNSDTLHGYFNMHGKHATIRMQTLLDTGACDAAALQNERSAWMQSIHDGSVLIDQAHHDIETFLEKDSYQVIM